MLDLTGQRFSKLVALRRAASVCRSARWVCQCDCGNEHIVRTGNLMSGAVKSCGCLNNVENKRKRCTTHGKSDTTEFTIWAQMRGRCNNPSNRAFKNYGGRGIKVCDRWDNSFSAFLEDMGTRPSLAHSLDRTDNNGNYEPGNCRWATWEQQQNNRRSNRRITYRGKTQTLMEATRSLGVRYDTVLLRIQKGWDVTDALETPIINHALIKRYFDMLERETGIPAKQLRKM